MSVKSRGFRDCLIDPKLGMLYCHEQPLECRFHASTQPRLVLSCAPLPPAVLLRFCVLPFSLLPPLRLVVAAALLPLAASPLGASDPRRLRSPAGDCARRDEGCDERWHGSLQHRRSKRSSGEHTDEGKRIVSSGAACRAPPADRVGPLCSAQTAGNRCVLDPAPSPVLAPLLVRSL